MKRVEQILAAVVVSASLMAVFLPSASSQPQSQQSDAATQALPPGLGRDTFTRVCSGCHVTALATSQRKTSDGWTDTVIEMRNRGANASDDELEQIVQYLSTNFGPASTPSRVNVNTAAGPEIASALSLQLAEADAIIIYRSKNGKFKDVVALERVPGVDSAKIEAAKNRIDF